MGSRRVRDDRAPRLRPATLAAYVLPGLVVGAALFALALWNPVLTSHLVLEDAPVEWLQVALALIAIGFVIAAARRHFSPVDVVLAALLIVLMIFETNIDRRLFGMLVIDGRFFASRTVPWPLKVLAAVVIAGAPLAVIVYAARRWREVWIDAWDGIRQGWVPLFGTGLALFLVTQLWEKRLNRALPLPPYFLEETIELVATLYLALGAWRRWQRLRSPR